MVLVPTPAAQGRGPDGDSGNDPKTIVPQPGLDLLPLLFFRQILFHEQNPPIKRSPRMPALLRSPVQALQSGTRSDPSPAAKVSFPPRPVRAHRHRRSVQGGRHYGPPDEIVS